MIKIDLANALSEKVGLKDGLNRRIFTDALAKNNHFVKKIFSLKNKPGYAFIELAEDKALIKKINDFAKSQKKLNWENIVVLGIGGSALGGIALRDATLGAYHYLGKKPHLFFLDNIDPDNTQQLLKSIKIEKSVFIVISKSGGTVEPMALYNLVKSLLIKKGIKNYQKNLIFVTDPEKGILRPIGKKEKITMFDVPPKVGGRFSVLSSVGLLPAALAGIDIFAILSGANRMLEVIKKSKSSENPALILALLQYLLDTKKQKIMTVMMPYSNLLFRFGDWYRQLLAESIGKNNFTGPTPITALGTTDQHSQLQLYNEGINNKWFIFLHIVKHLNDPKSGNNLPDDLHFINNKRLGEIIDAAYIGTSEALAKNKRPNITLHIPKIDAEVLGELFILFEFQVALLGLLYKVDAFNQPGVEESKIITKKILSKTK